MKKKIIAFCIGLIVLSCNTESASEKGLETSTNEMMELNTSKFEELAVDPCNLLTEEMITTRFGVKKDELNQSKYSSAKGKVSWSAYCTYAWKKPNHDEIQTRIQEKMIAAMSSGDTKNAMNVATQLEKANFEVGITNLKIFSDSDKALKGFEQSHIIPGKADVEELNQTLESSENPNLSNEQKEVAKDLAKGIQENLKFDKVEGVGTIAYWDYMGNKLDVLFGTIQIGIIMHISENHQENVDAAKKLANDIMKQF